MQAYWTLTRRELASFFVSLNGYVVMAASVFLIGWSFVGMLSNSHAEPLPVPLTQLFFSTVFFWLILVLASPIITMRLFALEKSSGTFETLMTTPVSDLQVVLAKFTAAMIFYLAMWLPLVAHILILRHYLRDPDALDWGLLGGTFFGLLLLGGLFLSFGCLASALTQNQVIAAIIAFTFGLGLVFLNLLPDYVSISQGWMGKVLLCFTLGDHMNDFARGLINTRYVLFYVTLTIFFLFLTLRVVESRRWK